MRLGPKEILYKICRNDVYFFWWFCESVSPHSSHIKSLLRWKMPETMTCYIDQAASLLRCGFFLSEGRKMETRVAIIGIIVENKDSVEALNQLLHDNGEYIIGRMGLPYRERNIQIISVVMDAPQDIISTLSGRIGKLQGVSAKTAYAKVSNEHA